MGLKEELQKIVNAERQKLDDKDVVRDKFDAEQKKRFVVLGNLLRKLSDEVDPSINISVSDDNSRTCWDRVDGNSTCGW